MGRIARDARLETRQARTRLSERHEPYWRQITTGVFIGYRKGKLGGAWYARYLHDGGYIKKRLGKADDRLDADGRVILDYKQAHKKAIELGEAPHRSRPGIDPRYTVGEAVDDYIRWYEGRRPATGALYNTRNLVETHIRPALGECRVADLTKDHLEQWHADLVGKRRGKATANRIVNALLAILNRAYDVGRVAEPGAWRRFKKFRGVNTPRIRFLSEDECIRLINAARPDFRPMVRAALLTGCRYGELVALTCADYNPDAATIYVQHSKSGEPRHVPLTDEGEAHFDSFTAGRPGDAPIFTRQDGGRWQRANQQFLMHYASQRAGIDPPASFHLLRHAYASLLVRSGVALQVVARALGHKNTRTTEEHYAHLQPDYVAEVIRAHLPSFGGKKANVRRLRNR